MSQLDRVFASVEWDIKYPLANLVMLPKGVSDHNPLKFSFGDKIQKKDQLFRFEK
jgi:hypothetical protein